IATSRKSVAGIWERTGMLDRAQLWLGRICVTCGMAVGLTRTAVAQAQTLRIVTYNIDADINGVTTPHLGLNQVLEGIGEENVRGTERPLDVLALQETTSNDTTVDPIITDLNAFYNGTAVYAQSPVQAFQAGSNAFGNGPNALVYNTKTLELVDS